MHNFTNLTGVQKLFAFVAILTLLVAGVFVGISIKKNAGEGIACTMEAKLCPDGSAVGRKGPSCEFAACPSGDTFADDGNIVHNNPGLKPDTWYLAYEMAGAPGLTTELLFDADSECNLEGKSVPCTSAIFRQGIRVRVLGTITGDGILVRTLSEISANETGEAVKLYYYDPESDKDAVGNIQCSRAGLVPVPRVLPKSSTPIRDAVKLLLRGEISSEERARGITSEFPLSGVALTGANLQNGILTLTFADQENRTVGGSCRVGILWFQIEATAKQFPGVQSVRFEPPQLFQP